MSVVQMAGYGVLINGNINENAKDNKICRENG